MPTLNFLIKILEQNCKNFGAKLDIVNIKFNFLEPILNFWSKIVKFLEQNHKMLVQN
jgi:hypothetical protein